MDLVCLRGGPARQDPSLGADPIALKAGGEGASVSSAAFPRLKLVIVATSSLYFEPAIPFADHFYPMGWWVVPFPFLSPSPLASLMIGD